MACRFDIYSVATGLYTGQTVSGPTDAIVEGLGPEFRAFRAAENPHAKKIAPGGNLEDYKPPSPSPDHVWESVACLWVETAAAIQRREAIAAVHFQIDALERQQARALREHAIGRGGTPAELKQRLEAIDDQITALRATLSP